MSRLPLSRALLQGYGILKERGIAVGAWLWKVIGWVWSSIIIGGLLAGGITSYITSGPGGLNNPRTWFIAHLLLDHPLQSAFILAIALIITFWAYQAFRSQQKTTQAAANPPSAMSNQDRQRMLTKVRAFWISDILEKSLHGEALIVLGLSEQSDVLASPLSLVLQLPDEPAHPLPPGTSIVEVYDKVGGELLILGEAGSGKTTLLLELTRNLLEKAARNDADPLPVVFNLSSWATKQEPITKWLVDELYHMYQVSRKLGEAWVSANQVLPLLDGLDEMPVADRTRCIDMINAYRQERGLLPMVICCRSADYLAQESRLLLHGAVFVQPLTVEQIEDYLVSAGEQLAAVRMALHEDAELRPLMATPLMLSVLTLAYRGVSVEELLKASAAERQQRVFDKYVEIMLPRREPKIGYGRQQTLKWLVWLARQMIQHNQVMFYIEYLQPSWLQGCWSGWLYGAFAIKLMDALLGFLVGIIVSTLFLNHVGAIEYGLVGLLVAVLIRRSKTGIENITTWSWQKFIKLVPIREGAIPGAIIGLIVGILYEIIRRVSIGASDVLLNILIGTLIGLVVGVLMNVRGTDIRPVEVIAWSWPKFIKSVHLSNGILIGAGIWLVNSLVFTPVYGFIYGLSGASMSWLLSGLVGSLSSVRLADDERVRANQGIQHSVRNGLRVGLVAGLTTGLLVGLCTGLAYELSNLASKGLLYGIFYGTVYGLFIGLVSTLLAGGEASMKHIVLRLLLWRSGCVPWNYTRFLDYAAGRILLRKVGGGYSFPHRQFLEYFEKLDVARVVAHSQKEM